MGLLRGGPARRWWVALAVVVAAPGALWALASPVLSVPDEPSHALTAVALWHGQRNDVEVVFPDGHVVAFYELPEPWAAASGVPRCYAGHPEVTADCAVWPSRAGEDEVSGSSAGRYPPLFYGLVGWGGRLWDGPSGVHAMRLASAALCGALVASAVWALARVVDRRLALAGVLVAWVPTAAFLAGSVNPNGFEVAAAVATWAAVLAVVRWPAVHHGPVPRSLLVHAAGATAVLSFSRTISPLFAGAVVVLAVVGAPPGALRRLWEWRAVRWAAAVGASAAVIAGALIVTSHVLVATPGSIDVGDRNPAVAALGQTGTYLEQMVGVFGWLDTPAPALVPGVWAGLGVGSLALAVRRAGWRASAGLLLTAVGIVVLPAVAQYPAAETQGLPWQGRYTLPLAVGIPLTAAVLLGSGPGRLGATALRRLGIGVALATGAASLVAFHAALRRYATGIGGPLDPRGGAWSPPGGAAWLLLAAVAVVAGAVALAAADPPAGPATPEG